MTTDPQDTELPDYYATLKIQQGRLMQAMKDMGIKTASELALRAGVDGTTVGKLLNFKKSPRCKTTTVNPARAGQWSVAVVKICQVLGAEPDDIFPEHLHHEIATNEISKFIEREQLLGYQDAPKQMGPDEECCQSETRAAVERVLTTLSSTQANVLKSRFWDEKTLDETGAMYSISRERVRQIENKALRTLRHPNKIKMLDGILSAT